MAERVTVNRKYKDRMFTMLFSEKKELLELYNAVNGTSYTDPELLEINTLENAIYLSMKNDISFIVDSRLSLYEHQSTFSPNLPLRYLFYISELLLGITREQNLYGRQIISIPNPKFVIFYNGEQKLEARMELKLSDAYTKKDDDYSLELKAVLLNINPPHNQELLDSCRTLKEYSIFTSRVRELAKKMSIEEAVEETIDYCIEEDILADFLKKNRAEVKAVSIFEYDQEKHMQQEREQEYAAGKKAGLEEGLEQGLEKGLEEGREEGRQEGREERRRIIANLFQAGVAIEQIAAAVGETEEEIKKMLTE